VRPKTGLPAAHGPEISKSKSRNQTYPNRRAPLQRHHAKISRFFEVSDCTSQVLVLRLVLWLRVS
jgi:hypothetical protein